MLQDKTVNHPGLVTADSGFLGLKSVMVLMNATAVSVFAFVKCVYEAGKAVSATNGHITLTGDTTGKYVFPLPESGDWVFSSDGNSVAKSMYEFGVSETVIFIYLPESNSANIKAEAYVDNFQANSSNWGGLTKNDVTKYTYVQGNDFVTIASDSLFYAPLSGEESFTAYYVLQCAEGNLARLLAIYTSETDPGKPCWFKEYGKYKAYDRRNQDTDFSALNKIVLAISRDAETGAVKWYINGTLFRTNTGYTQQPNYIYYNGTGNSYLANTKAYFMGLVLGAENDETVLGNMQNLMNLFGI